MLEKLKYEDYAAQLNTKFRLVDAAQPIELELVNISEHFVSPGQERFSLVFRGAPDFFLPQGVFQFAHDALGTGAVFLVPVGQDANGFKYEAVFNRLVENA